MQSMALTEYLILWIETSFFQGWFESNISCDNVNLKWQWFKITNATSWTRKWWNWSWKSHYWRFEDEEAEEEDKSCTRVTWSPKSHCFGLEWTEVPRDVPAYPEFGENIRLAVACPTEMSSLDYFSIFLTTISWLQLFKKQSGLQFKV